MNEKHCGLGDISVVLSLMSKMRTYLTPTAHVSDMKGLEEEGVSQGCGQSLR